ncbi:MAG TPA: glycosyltransferase [Holophaga sp.]|nr:glycosyltransferase [Holophaga sp.]
MPTICLNMIVRNEAHVIRRCLDSVRPVIDHWVILDTGSTDGTQDIIREHLKDLPGELFEAPWTNFGQARTEALERVGDRADYILVMDADDVLEWTGDAVLPPLDADAYLLDFRLGTCAYSRVALVSTRFRWRFVGVVHEYLEASGPWRGDFLEGVVVRAGVEGARSADPEKYLKDARLLEEALARDPGNHRYAYYLGQSYRDAGLKEEALAQYLRRADMGGWREEAWHALYQAARIMEELGRPREAVVRAYLRAQAEGTGRAEPLCFLARYLSLQGDPHRACAFAEQGLAIPRPARGLFLEEAVHDWLLMDVFSMAAFGAGRLEEAALACRCLLENAPLPPGERPRVEANLAMIEARRRADAASRVPVAFVLASTPHGALLVDREDQHPLPGAGPSPGRQLLGASFLEAGDLDLGLEMLRLRRRQGKGGLLAVDCGADIGVHALEWARAMAGWGEVLALESRERVFYALAGNLAMNNCLNARALLARVAGPGAGEVPTRTLDTLGLARMDLLRVVLGSLELEALEGARGLLARDRPHLLVGRAGLDETRIRAFLEGLGYRMAGRGPVLAAIHGEDPGAILLGRLGA